MANKKTGAPASPAGIKLDDFTAEQKFALLDLLTLAMYCDGDLAKVEEARAQQLLAAMGFASEYDRNREFDACITRIRRQSQTPSAVQAATAKLAAAFTPEQQSRVYNFLADFAAVDSEVSQAENQFLGFVKAAFGK